ncbi:MAG: LysR family transcriptional regulator for metE and metH [Candidatus Aldehydirespiratoraceae bacterium]|jgi:LysR family transcriptional regulator for metE and metH
MQPVHESLERQHFDLLVDLRHSGTLAAAAQTLHISASAASHRLKEAERRLGIALTATDGRSIRLTAAGQHLAEVGEIAQRNLRSAEATARWMNSADRPAVRIALDFYDTAPWFEQLIGLSDLPTDVDFLRVGHNQTVESVQRRITDLGVIVLAPGGPEGDVLSADHLVGVVRNDHPAARRGELEPGDIVDATYITVGDRPTHGFEHHQFFEPAGVRPHRLRKVESLAMALRLMRSFGGITVQPSLALRTPQLDGLVIVPLAGAMIPVRWDIVLRDEPEDHEVAMADAIRRLVETNPTQR